MKKLSLKNVQLNAGNLLSTEEKKQTTGGRGCALICYSCGPCYDSCQEHEDPCLYM